MTLIGRILPHHLIKNKLIDLVESNFQREGSNDIVSTKTYDKRGNFDFEIVNFPF